MIGALAFHRFIARNTPGDDGDDAAEQARRFGYWSAVILIATVPYRVMMQASGLTLDGDPWGPMVQRVLTTGWGHAAIWQGAAAFIAAVSFIRLRERMEHHWTQARVAALVLAVVPAFMGHAGAVESWRWTAIAADTMHVIAAGSWAGALSLLTMCALRLRVAQNGGMVLAGYVNRFGPLAQRSVATIIVTGVISSLLHVGAFGALTTTGYGVVLLTKLGLVFVALFLGYRHSITAAGQLRMSGVRRVLPTFLIEWAVLILVLAVTGLLAGSPPPGTE